jgi:hypothetical protein
MRFQTLIDRGVINYAGVINEVEYYAYYGYGGTFNNYKAYLCHTDKSALVATFASNYKGTPVLVASFSAFTIAATKTWLPLKMTGTFTYNNTDNLLVEIVWQGKVGTPRGEPVYSCFFGSGAHRVWANSSTATTGTPYPLAYYHRLNFGYYTALGPTSLGRVKAMYE